MAAKNKKREAILKPSALKLRCFILCFAFY